MPDIDEGQQELDLDLLEDDALEPDPEDDNDEDAKPPAQAAPKELTASEKQQIALDWMRSNPAPVKGGDDGEDPNETLEGLISRISARQNAPTIAAQALVAAELISQKAASQYGLDAAALKELDEQLKWLRPDQVIASLHPAAIKQLAATAKGMAGFSNPPEAAPVNRNSGGGLKWHPSVTQEQVKEYMALNGIEKLSAAHVKELKKDGYIVS